MNASHSQFSPQIGFTGRKSQSRRTLGIFVNRILGCWHRRLSWPFTDDRETYRVCLSCGARRRFKTDSWQGTGGYYFADAIPEPRAEGACEGRMSDQRPVETPETPISVMPRLAASQSFLRRLGSLFVWRANEGRMDLQEESFRLWRRPSVKKGGRSLVLRAKKGRP